MATASEATPFNTQMGGAIRDGLEAVSLDQEIEFQVYNRVVLPLDGFIFWQPSHTVKVKGALHYSQQMVQSEDETLGQATVKFTSVEELTDFNSNPAITLYVGTADDGFQFALSQSLGFFSPVGVWVYSGRSVQPALSSQLLSPANPIDPNQAVVSNSLPLWLALNGYESPFYDGFSNDGTPFVVKPPVLYPSFIVDENEIPPYGSVHIGDNDTQALQAAPYLDSKRSHYQLCQDHVRITLYGLQNDVALDFMDTVNQYSLTTGNFGIMNTPVIRDAIRTQSEIRARAMKKVVEFDCSYNQARVADVARQLIKQAAATYIFPDGAQ